MIHYHGTPVGGKQTERAAFLQGRHALVSFLYQGDMPLVADLCQSFILDNGAFSAWKKGIQVDWDGYYTWVRSWHRHPGFDFALIPDVIGGSEEENDRLLSLWPKDLNGVPVYHVHEPTDRLLRLAEDYPTVALGSSGEFSHPGSNVWWGRMEEIMDAVCEEGVPRCKLHGLRMLNPSVFSRLPLSSADSVNASVNAGSLGRFGLYVPVSRAQRASVIADRIEAFNSSAVWVGKGKWKVDYDFDEHHETDEAILNL